MKYRNLKKEEMKEVKKLQSNVYFMKYDEDKPVVNPDIDKIRWKFARGAFTDKGKLAAVLEIIPFKSFLDGIKVGSGGIAGVATLLEYRRRGAVKNLLKNAFEEMNEKGDVMSYLYPFSHEYYRKYGYSQGSYGDMITADITQFKDFNSDGYTKQYFPGDGFDDLKRVYNKFARKYNCCIAREDWRWKSLFSGDPYKTNERVFIRYSQKGKPIAYIKMKTKEVSAYTYNMVVVEAAWTEYEGLLGMIAIINGYKGDFKKLKLDVPAGFPIELLVKETWELEVNRNHTGMNRIINAEKALGIIRKPEDSGKVIISLIDEHAPWNTGNWLVEWDKIESQVSKTKKEADIKCTAPSFSQLVTGHMPLNYMQLKTDVEIKGNKNTLEKLFIKKSCFLWDRF